MKHPKLPLVQLPTDMQLTLFLIQQELKSRKFFHGLFQVGIEEVYFRPHLDSAIIRAVGIYDGKDETFNLYNEIMERRSRKIEADQESITKQSLKVYQELVELKRMCKL